MTEIPFKTMTNKTVTEAKPAKTVEVHNAYTIYGLDHHDQEVERPIVTFSRPQDWGYPRWHYEKCRFEWWYKDTHYINNCHCWTNLQREPHQYLQLFASFIVQIFMPSSKPQLCGNQYLADDDFWEDSWGPMPPYFEEDDDSYDDE